MKHFDIDITKNLDISSFEGESLQGTTDIKITANTPEITQEKTKETTSKGGFIEGAKSYQNLIKSFTEYGADKEGYGYYEKYKDPTGKKKKILGLDPLVFIAVSLGLIIASGIAIVLLKPKKQ
jgi:hypothetical protein